jgi:proteasome lid subunit RPN8/RPN11
MELSVRAIKLINLHASAVFPNECCGVITGNDYCPMANISSNTLNSFKISGAEFIRVNKLNKVQAVIHSHCIDPKLSFDQDPRWASHLDMEGWIASDIPWGIVATNGINVMPPLWYDDTVIEPLEGRNFVHGITDCYAIIRDYYRLELGIKLNNYAREMSWWNAGKDLYSENFNDAGFVEISKEEATTNDCCLFQVRSPVINHAAVITGNNEILHHLFHRLSGKDQLHKWERNITKYVRYIGKE